MEQCGAAHPSAFYLNETALSLPSVFTVLDVDLDRNIVLAHTRAPSQPRFRSLAGSLELPPPGMLADTRRHADAPARRCTRNAHPLPEASGSRSRTIDECPRLGTKILPRS